MNNIYTNYISLGYFCSIADDLEKLGLRNQSSPFDWGISDFPNVIKTIDTNFKGFMDYDNLSQSVNIRKHYRDDKFKFYFFHDFNEYKSLDAQYDFVKSKYYRRIKRFLESIKQPTLFIRYISTEELDENNKSIELIWIENNYDYILNILKKFNQQNNIIFIGDETLKSDKIKIYTVFKDTDDLVSRLPIYNNKELFPILSSIDFPNKQDNIERYNKKQKSYTYKIKAKIICFLQKKFLKVYTHSKTYNIPHK